MNDPVVVALLAALFAATLSAAGWAVRRQITGQDANRRAITDLGERFAAELNKVAVTLAELNTGASAGARAAITDLRAELRAGLRDVSHDLGQLRSEHDNLAERHHSLNGTTVQLAERVNGTRELLFELRREIAR